MKSIDIFYADDDEDDMMFFNDAVDQIKNSSKNQVFLHLHMNGESLIENLKKNKSNNGVAFLDINMPLKNGFEFLKDIRNEPEIQNFPVIMYSTSSNPVNVEQCQKLGADLYVVKPSNFNDLVRMISDFIQMDWKNHKSNPANFLYKR